MTPPPPQHNDKGTAKRGHPPDRHQVRRRGILALQQQNALGVIVLLAAILLCQHDVISSRWTSSSAFHQGLAHWRLLGITSRKQERTHELSNVLGAASNPRKPAEPITALNMGFFGATTKANSVTKESPSQTRGKVTRTASRPYQVGGGSIPSSRLYTTRKDSSPSIQLTSEGVMGDYNHYRTVALKSTGDRALSILTEDVNSLVKTINNGFYANNYRDGDLGENVLVDGVDFDFFKIGKTYRFTSQPEGAAASPDDTMITITEPMEACANLCKLPYINDYVSKPKERIAKCKGLIEALNQMPGLRGWYAKIIHPGTIRVGDRVAVV